MKSVRIIRFSAAILLAAASALFVVGCATGDNPNDVSERPWNDTQGWQGGMPSNLNEGR